MNQEIKAALLEMLPESNNPIYAEVVNDCLGYLNTSITALEGYFDSCLWYSAEEGFENSYASEQFTANKEYVMVLASVEENLVHQRLIYNS